jgi:hypothetical protein
MRLPVLLVLFLCSLYASATEGTLQGVVADSETKEAIPYAPLSVRGKPKGCVADEYGHFTLKLEGLTAADTIQVVYMGYETLKESLSQALQQDTLWLVPARLELAEVQIHTGNLSAEEIIRRMQEQYVHNHGAIAEKQRLFFHHYEEVPFGKNNKIQLKSSDFEGLEVSTFEKIFAKLPESFSDYRDALLELYHYEGKYKLLPIEGIALEEGGLRGLFEEIEQEFGDFLKDVEQGMADEKIYYKIKTGILSQKIGHKKSIQVDEEEQDDSLHYRMETDWLKGELIGIRKKYTDIGSKEWEFVHQPGKYRYTLEGLTIQDGIWVYCISFDPKKKGLYEGRLYIESDTYALLRMEYNYAPGKTSENFQLLGFGHAIRDKKAYVLFEKDTYGYFVRYMCAREKEWVKVDRNVTIVKKEKRKLIDKELGEMKLDIALSLEVDRYMEVLVLERETILPEIFDKTSQPEMIVLRKEYADKQQMKQRRTSIVPNAALKKYGK